MSIWPARPRGASTSTGSSWRPTTLRTWPVQAFYRPEDVELRPATPDAPADGSLTAHVERIVRTRPLARISLGCDPPIAALMLHRDVNHLQLTAGNPVQVTMPAGSLRVFPARAEP